MTKQDIIGAILSKDSVRVAEAKTALKEILNARAAQFRTDSTKFVAKSLFEATSHQEALEAKYMAEAKLNGQSWGPGNPEQAAHHSTQHLHHNAKAEEHKSKWLDTSHWEAYKAHTIAANHHQEASLMHQHGHPNKDKKTQAATLATSTANAASTAAEAANVHKDD